MPALRSTTQHKQDLQVINIDFFFYRQLSHAAELCIFMNLFFNTSLAIYHLFIIMISLDVTGWPCFWSTQRKRPYTWN